MATRVQTITTCDMPHDDEVTDAMPVTVTTPDGTWEVDVCPDHAARHLMPVIASARRVGRAPRTRVAV